MPTEESVRRAMVIPLIINCGWGLAKNENPNAQMVLSYVRQHGRIKRAEAMELCRLSEWQTKGLLKRMCDAGAIALHGTGKASVYWLGPAQAG